MQGVGPRWIWHLLLSNSELHSDLRYWFYFCRFTKQKAQLVSSHTCCFCIRNVVVIQNTLVLECCVLGLSHSTDFWCKKWIFLTRKNRRYLKIEFDQILFLIISISTCFTCVMPCSCCRVLACLHTYYFYIRKKVFHPIFNLVKELGRFSPSHTFPYVLLGAAGWGQSTFWPLQITSLP